jgi:hypothetical protein
MQGQDYVSGPRRPKKTYPESSRSKRPVRLRLAPEVADALIEQSELRRMDRSAYVTMLLGADDVVTHSRPAPATSEFYEMLEEVSRLAHAVHQLPDEVQRLRGELGRQGGLVKHLVEQGQADPYRSQTAEAVLALKQIAGTADIAVRELLNATAPIRHELERIAQSLAFHDR